MVVLVVNNSFSRIIGLKVNEEKELRDKLSYTVGSYSSYYSGGFGPRKKSLLTKRSEFPTGLLHRVEKYLIGKTVPYAIQDDRKTPTLVKPGFLKLDNKPYQSQTDAVKLALHYKRGTISMSTGSGKSLVIAMIAAELNLRTLVVVPSLEIKKQLTAALKGLKNVVIENIDSRKLLESKDFDCLIIDEAHHSAARTYQKLNKTAWSGIFYRFFLTATPFRNDTEETLLFESIAGEIIFDWPYKKARDAKQVVPVDAFYIEVPKSGTDAYSWQEVYKELVVKNEVRNMLLAYTLVKLHENDVYTLCLVKEVYHGKLLEDMTGLPFASGADDESRAFIQTFNQGGIKTLIATEALLGEGVDTKPCEYVIIAGLGKAKSSFMQKVGRAVRNFTGKESAKVIIFKDNSHKFTKRHFSEQKKILLDVYGAIPVKLDL